MYFFIYICLAFFIASASASIYGLIHHSLISELGAIAFGILSYIALGMEKINQ
jgi:hypothetical protein